MSPTRTRTVNPIQLPLPQSIRWALVERSPFNPPLQA
jgi:hypothetical protein